MTSLPDLPVFQAAHVTPGYICGVALAAALALLLSGCFASKPRGPHLIAETVNERLEDLTVGEYLWAVSVVENSKLYSTGQVVKSSQAQLYYCRKDDEVGALCTPVEFGRVPRQAAHPVERTRVRDAATVPTRPTETPAVSPRVHELCRKYAMSLGLTSMGAIRTATKRCKELAREKNGDTFLECVDGKSRHADVARCGAL